MSARLRALLDRLREALQSAGPQPSNLNDALSVLEQWIEVGRPRSSAQ